MNIISFSFVLFSLALIALYYVVPSGWQWPLLLIFSGVFYCAAGIGAAVFILIAWIVSYFAARIMESMEARRREMAGPELSKEEKAALRRQTAKSKKAVLILSLVLCVGILVVFKYTGFALGLAGRVFGKSLRAPSLMAPLGISFYTFMTVGYLCDVYWNKTPAEKNPLKLLLLTCFFPHITQGPISVYGELSKELFRPHALNGDNLTDGLGRALWGFFKKTVVANTLAPFTAALFAGRRSFSGPTLFLGALLYCVQTYADFSGYMDIMCGLCRTLDIKLAENFSRPYFSKSVAEYWRRWHITLGAWFKTYVYYPIALSGPNRRLGKRVGEKLGPAFGKNLPATLALLAVWSLTGLWHGANLGYLAWGLCNGAVIIFSLWAEPLYEKGRRALKMRDGSFFTDAFRVGRTFVLMSFIKLLPDVGGLRAGLSYWKRIFTNGLPKSFSGLFSFAADKKVLLVAAAGAFLMLVVSLIERKTPVSEFMKKRLPYPARLLLMVILTLGIVYFGVPRSVNAGGFMYAQF